MRAVVGSRGGISRVEEGAYVASVDDLRLVAILFGRRGASRAFMELVDLYGMQMLRVAQMYVSTRAVAEEVVQDTWLAVLGARPLRGRARP